MYKQSLIKNLLERRIPQILGSYLVAGTSLILFIEYLIEKYQFPSYYPTLALFALIGILPTVIILTYFHGAPGKDEWTMVEKIGIPINVLFIAGILFFGDSQNIWNLEENKMSPISEKVLIHITSLPGYIDKYMGEDHYTDIKGRKLIPLSIDKLESVRKNIESILLGEFIDTDYDMEVKNSSEDVTFLNKYSVLSFDSLSFSNVSINYKRFKCNRLHYINVYQFEKELDSSRPKYYFSEMRWIKLPSSGWNGRFAQADFTIIEDQIFGFMREMYIGSGQVGTVISIEDEIVYIKLNNLKIKENMNLVGESSYDFSQDGRKDRIDDLTNGITYLSNYSDTTSQLQIKLYNDEILSIQNGTGFNWISDKDGNVNTRIFTVGLLYKLKVVDLHSDSIAVTKITELSYPYVQIRAGDQIRVE